MFDSVIFDVALGLMFIYLILGLICSAVQEIIAGALGFRSKTLRRGIENLLADPNIEDLSSRVYEHPLVAKLSRVGKNPSYIPARNFAVALLDVLRDPGAGDGPLTEAGNTVKRLPDGPIKKTLVGLLEGTENKIDRIRNNIEEWFDNSMDRVSGWYKRSAHFWTIGISLALSVGLNADTVCIAKQLWSDPALRAEFVALAEKQATTVENNQKITELRKQLDSLPLGWSNTPTPMSPLGWILTALAASLGAPFWFDLLGKLINLRGSGPKPKKAVSSS